jgi:peptidoglycan/LPS O-acetylase OafA/YrhL
MDPAWLSIITLAAQADIMARPGWLTTRWIVYAGEVSFVFYLVHQGTLLQVATHVGPGPLAALASVVIAACCAIVVHHLIELPFQRAILTHFPKLRIRRIAQTSS